VCFLFIDKATAAVPGYSEAAELEWIAGEELFARNIFRQC
jgi:hypothetical protein